MSCKLRINWLVVYIILSVHVIITVLLMEWCFWIIDLHALATLSIVRSDLLLIKLYMSLLLILINVLKNTCRVCLYHLNFLLQSYN